MSWMSFIIGTCFALVVLLAISMLRNKGESKEKEEAKKNMSELRSHWKTSNVVAAERNYELKRIADALEKR